MNKKERSESEEEKDKGEGCLKKKDVDLGEGSILGKVRGTKPREEEVANGRLLGASLRQASWELKG